MAGRWHGATIEAARGKIVQRPALQPVVDDGADDQAGDDDRSRNIGR
jgi:hypothetical protein